MRKGDPNWILLAAAINALVPARHSLLMKEAMTASGQVRSFGTTVLRVRSLGYTGRELEVAGTSLASHMQTI